MLFTVCFGGKHWPLVVKWVHIQINTSLRLVSLKKTDCVHTYKNMQIIRHRLLTSGFIRQVLLCCCCFLGQNSDTNGTKTSLQMWGIYIGLVTTDRNLSKKTGSMCQNKELFVQNNDMVSWKTLNKWGVVCIVFEKAVNRWNIKSFPSPHFPLGWILKVSATVFEVSQFAFGFDVKRKLTSPGDGLCLDILKKESGGIHKQKK